MSVFDWFRGSGATPTERADANRRVNEAKADLTEAKTKFETWERAYSGDPNDFEDHKTTKRLLKAVEKCTDIILEANKTYQAVCGEGKVDLVKQKPRDSAVELSTIHPDIQENIWKSVVRISCDDFVGSGLVIDKFDEDVEGLGRGLYILTNLHLLGADKSLVDRVSGDFKKELKKLDAVGKLHAKRIKKPKLDLQDSKKKRKFARNDKSEFESQDPLKVNVEQYRGQKLMSAFDFILDETVCWEASSNFDFMIFKVPIPQNCLLEKCDYTQFYCDPMKVHIFGFPGAVAGDLSFEHDYAVIPAQITGRNSLGHLLLWTPSTPGLSGSAIVCTEWGCPIGYLGGGFDTGEKNQQYQCYGYGFTGLPRTLPRFARRNRFRKKL